MNANDKDVVWLRSEIKTPPLSKQARLEAGFLLRQLQLGSTLSMPQSRPMPSIGRRCHELRINDNNSVWRIVYRIDPDAIVILAVFDKKTRAMPKHIIELCKDRISSYDNEIS